MTAAVGTLVGSVVLALPGFAILAISGWYISYCLSQRSFADRLAAGDEDSLAAVNPGDEVILSGTAHSIRDTLDAPATGTPCLAYEFKTQRHVPDASEPGKDMVSWSQELLGGQSVPFRLDTDDGVVMVESVSGSAVIKKQSNLDIYTDEVTEQFEADQLPHEVEQLLEESENDSREDGRRRKVTERKLADGETAVVSGVLRRPSEIDRTVPRDARYVVGPKRESEGLSLPSRPVFKIGGSSMEDLAAELHRGANWGLGIGGVGLLIGIVWCANVLL